jgi:hypothetical protein
VNLNAPAAESIETPTVIHRRQLPVNSSAARLNFFARGCSLIFNGAWESGAMQGAIAVEDIDLVFKNARATIAECRKRADVLNFLADEVEGRSIIGRMQHEARVLNLVTAAAPSRRREAELLMGECAKVWTQIATAKPWAWR